MGLLPFFRPPSEGLQPNARHCRRQGIDRML